MSGFFVTAQYEPRLDDRRRQRIEAAITRSGARWGAHDMLDSRAIPIVFSDVDWCCGDDDTETELEIFIADREQAGRLASELRACGMTASVRSA